MYDEIIPVMADANLIVQVIVNLMDNAVKYSDEDSDVTVSVHRENAYAVVISVSDHGTGISDEEKEKVFDMEVSGVLRSWDMERSILALSCSFCARSAASSFSRAFCSAIRILRFSLLASVPAMNAVINIVTNVT